MPLLGCCLENIKAEAASRGVKNSISQLDQSARESRLVIFRLARLTRFSFKSCVWVVKLVGSQTGATSLPGETGIGTEQSRRDRENACDAPSKADETPPELRFRVQLRIQDQEMSHLPVAVSERMGWRTHLPPVQVYCGVAKWRA